MRLRLDLNGLVAVHSARAACTALGALEGVHGVRVERGTAWVDHDGRLSAEQCAAALDVVGLTIREAVADRTLPIL